VKDSETKLEAATTDNGVRVRRCTIAQKDKPIHVLQARCLAEPLERCDSRCAEAWLFRLDQKAGRNASEKKPFWGRNGGTRVELKHQAACSDAGPFTSDGKGGNVKGIAFETKVYVDGNNLPEASDAAMGVAKRITFSSRCTKA
jgi:hypothetical protein